MANLHGEERARYVTRMFSRIACRYDLLNTVMTAGRHHAWRRAAVDSALNGMAGPALDIATGTGDFALELARRPSVAGVVGLDFTGSMLSVAKTKAQSLGLAERVTLAVADAHSIPFSDDRFVCATVGFGIRNFIDVPRALREIARVLKPGGRVVLLEIVRMAGDEPVSWLFRPYFRYLTPLLGAVIAGERDAYTYLPESVERFFSAGELATMMVESGLSNVTVRRLALGSVTINVGEKL